MAWLQAKEIWYRIATRLGLKLRTKTNEPYLKASDDPDIGLHIALTRFSRHVYTLAEYRKASGGLDPLPMIPLNTSIIKL